jgi:hypothetical protein
MTIDTGPLALRCLGPPGVRRRLYAALARSLAAHAGSAAIVLESTLDAPVPAVLVRPASVALPLFADPTFEGAIELGADPDVPRPPAGAFERQLALCCSPGSGGAAAPSISRGPASARALLGPGGWLAVQTLWARDPGGRTCAARRAWVAAPSRADLDSRWEGIGAALSEGWSVTTGVRTTPAALGWRARGAWEAGRAGGLPRAAWIRLPSPRLEATAEIAWAPDAPYEPAAEGHALVLGASGAGKSWLLADRAARAIARGEPVLVIDLHGDLAPAIVARLTPRVAHAVVGIDLSDPPFPGVAAVDPRAPPDRAAAHLVAALKRLSADGSEIHWGFRLERILDSFVRLVQEADGTLLDLYALLTDRERREAARLRTRRPELARFLEELGPIVARTPDFLWPAAARLSKIVLVPELARLLAPEHGGLPIEHLLAQGRSVLLRVPFARIGPEAAQFAGSVVLARTYLGLAAAGGVGRGRPPVLVVLDEVQGFSPRLIAEMVAEGRKFGVRILLATQYPERMAPELRSAAAGAVRDLVVFRVPPASATAVGLWLGVAPADAATWLSDLPPGYGFARDPDGPELRPLAPRPGPPSLDPDGWRRAVSATRAEFAPEPSGAEPETNEPAVERLLLAVLGAEERGERVPPEALVPAALALPGEPVEPSDLAQAEARLLRQGYLEPGLGTVRLTPAGERRLGLGAATGATRETPEHRALLLEAFRLLARRGYRLEIVRQGRWDTTLPDGLLRQLPGSVRAATPAALSEMIDAARNGWAWRFFGGRDVHVEAEVSGALRPERIRHGVRKAVRAGAFPLFVVADPHRAGRVRATLRALGLPPREAQVWMLRGALAARPARSAERP